MRRKSGRSSKASPDKTGSDTPKKLRRQSSRRHKRSSSRSSVDSNDGRSNVKEPVQGGGDNNPYEDNETSNISKNIEESSSPTRESKVKSSSDGENPERKSLRCRSSLNKNISEDSQEQAEGMEEKKNKGKSKGKNKSNIEQSTNIIEPEIEHENVQGTPQSPSNDNADNENVQNVNDTAKIDVESHEENNKVRGSESVENTQQSVVNFESEYVQENADNDNQQNEESDTKTEHANEPNEESSARSQDENMDSQTRKSLSEKEDCSDLKLSSKRSSKEERSLTPEIKSSAAQKSEGTHEDYNCKRKSSDQSGRAKSENREHSSSKKKITLRRSPLQNNDTNKCADASPVKERRSTIEESGKEAEDREEKPRKKITLKRTNVDERVSGGEKGEEKAPDDESARRSSANEDLGEKKRRLSSLCEDKGQDGEEKPKKMYKKIRLIRSLSRGNDDSHEEKTKLLSTQRKQRWSRADWLDKLSFYKIDVDSIKIVCPSLAFLAEDEVHLESTPRERRKSESDAKRKISMDKSDDERSDYEKQTSEESSGEQKIELNPNIIAMNRKISIVDDTASKLRPPPSPAKHPTSDVLYISNLVRPFTVKQLKELLERTGKIREDGFWTDRIKSKCYVRYESVEEAEATRNALHGVHWPIGNGKQLVIDYATPEDLDKAKNPAPPPKPVVDIVPEKENRQEPVVKVDEKHKERGERERDREKEERKRRDGPVREWDLGKEESRRAHSRSRSRSRERVRKHSRRSYTPEILDYMHRKQRKVEEPVPQKLMDDLFLKTKATPSIYWQPLSSEEIAMKQKQRLVRMEEHKRRIEETRVRLRDSRRGSFRRR